MIKPLVQNLEYFRYPKNIIKSVELDIVFNDIVKYLNEEIIFNINAINNKNIIGSTDFDKVDNILKINSQGNYFWKKIDNEDFEDKSINISKLKGPNFTRPSVFIAGVNGNIEPLCFIEDSDSILICDNKGIRFDKLDNNYITNFKISTEKIAYETITHDNLKNINAYVVADNSIIGEYFKNQIITKNKIVDGSIDLDSFDNDTKELLTKYIWKEIIPKNFIDLSSNFNINSLLTSMSKIKDNFSAYLVTNLFKIFKNQPIIGSHGHSKCEDGLYSFKEDPYVIPVNKFGKFYVKNIIKYYTRYSNFTEISRENNLEKGQPAVPKLKRYNKDLLNYSSERRYILSPNNFKPNSINPNRLVCWFNTMNTENCHNINDILANETLTLEHFTPAIQAKLGVI